MKKSEDVPKLQPQATLTVKTVGMILDYIRTNKLQAGDLLPPESRFVDILGVSRVILREACSYLKGLGVLTSRRGSGFRIEQVSFADVIQQVLTHVSPLNLQHFEELYELRRYLEIGTVAQSVAAATEEDQKKIQAALDQFAQLICKQNIPMSDYQRIELDFHHAIMAPGQCRLLNIINAAINAYFAASEELNGKLFHNDRTMLQRELQEHQMIATAFFLGWPDVAEMCLKKHLRQAVKKDSAAKAR